MMAIVSFFLLLLQATSANVVVERDVMVLNDENFDSVIGSNDFVMVEFYAPWCGHCKALAPEWEIAATILKNETNIKFGKVDTSNKASEAITTRFMISGFPTIFFFKYQNKVEYTGAREADAIVSWAYKHSGPSAAEITTVDEIGIAKKNFDVFVIGYFSDPVSALRNTYFALADVKEHIKFLVTQSKEVAAHLGLRRDALVILKAYDEGRADLDLSAISPDTAEKDMETFVVANTYPLVSVFYNRDAQKIFSPRITTHALLFTDEEADHHAPTIALATDIARHFRGKVQFINILAEDKAKLNFFEVDADKLPVIIGVDVDEMERYPFTGPFQKKEIAEHLQLVLDRTLKD